MIFGIIQSSTIILIPQKGMEIPKCGFGIPHHRLKSKKRTSHLLTPDQTQMTMSLEFGNNHELDPNIVAGIYIKHRIPILQLTLTTGLPHNPRVVSTSRHGSSYWDNTLTGRINVIQEDDTPQSYFIKVLTQDRGKSILHGEYESMKKIHAVVPDYVPKPIVWGTYKHDPDTHFFICEYREMNLARDRMPDPAPFAERLAALHQRSEAPNNGQFGFHVPTYSGYLPQYTGWEESWEVFFAKSLRVALDMEVKAKGHDAEFERLVPAIFEGVIPRLLRPLQSEGRSVKPSLVHGDLWYGNSGVDKETGECLVFDACCFYAHHECMSPVPRPGNC